MSQQVAPTSEATKDLTRAETFDAIRMLQNEHVAAYQDALKAVDPEDHEAEEIVQLAVHTSLAKSRDKLFIEQNIGEADIEQAVRSLNLERDPEFNKLMAEQEKRMAMLFKEAKDELK